MHGVTHFRGESRRTGDPSVSDTDLPTSTRLGPKSFTDEKGQTLTYDAGFWCIDGRVHLASAQRAVVNRTYWTHSSSDNVSAETDAR